MHAEQLPENELLSLNALNVNTVIDPNMQDHQLPSVLESFSFTEANIYTDENLVSEFSFYLSWCNFPYKIKLLIVSTRIIQCLVL
uniref:Orphan protein n=1 Tax=Schistosoma mansoni TaxID=6183 RepID=A0A5K4FCP7_SCHMA